MKKDKDSQDEGLVNIFNEMDGIFPGLGDLIEHVDPKEHGLEVPEGEHQFKYFDRSKLEVDRIIEGDTFKFRILKVKKTHP